MAEHPYFQKALSDFTFDMAGGGVIRHLADRGYTVRQIKEELAYPIPFEKVQQAVWDHLIERQVILLEEPGNAAPAQKAVYIEEKGKFGKTSFRRVLVSNESCQQIDWKEAQYSGEDGSKIRRVLSEKTAECGSKAAYVSCDFGIFKKKEPKEYAALADALDDRQREYIEGLPWIDKRVYHRMDQRMTEITYRLLRLGLFDGSCYFMDLGEKIVIGGKTNGNKLRLLQ